jgi:hypothetical protein
MPDPSSPETGARGVYVRPNAKIRGLAGVGQLTAVAQAIQTQEGWYPGSVSYTDNNPGNLMAVGQSGCTATPAGFCSFATYADGWNALLNQISLDASRGMSISQFTASYAPASAGNDPVTYASNIADAVGLSPSDSLAAAISQSGASGGLPGGIDLSDVGGDITSYITGGLQDLSDAVDSGGGVDLSSIGLGIVDPSVLILGGVVVLLALWMGTRK